MTEERHRLFTVGPVEIAPEVLAVGARQPPYFRGADFAARVAATLDAVPPLLKASEGSRAALLTASGTAAVEASVINLFDEDSEVLVVDGGSFGRRLVEICQAHRISHRVEKVEPGHGLDLDRLEAHADVDGVLTVAHETSTGELFDIQSIGAFCRRVGALFVVDAISSFMADPFEMECWGVDTVALSVNKGLAVPPGVSFVVMNERARSRLRTPRSFYLRLEDYFTNAERGMTPYTPAIGVFMQLEKRLELIERSGGVDAVIARVGAQAADFRRRIAALGVPLFASNPSSYASALALPHGTSEPLCHRLREEYRVVINPTTWGFEHDVPKICHAGEQDTEDNRLLVDALGSVLHEMGVLA